MKKKNQARGKLIRKSFWLTKENKKNIEAEAKNFWENNQSALVRHIISNWFKK